jgi:hypothetical protein
MSYSCVKVFVNAAEHKALLDYCNAQQLKYEVETPISLSVADTKYKKPTKSLKSFCGPERTNSKGLIQANSAIELMITYATRADLITDGGIMVLNEALQDALSTNDTSIPLSSLPSRVNALLVDA